MIHGVKGFWIESGLAVIRKVIRNLELSFARPQGKDESVPIFFLLRYCARVHGLATGGSGDVLAGIAAGLVARGTDPLAATLWAVWLHGEAGRRCAERQGPLGFLARELLAHVPGLMRAV